MAELLDHVELESDQTATASIIWLHGLGADGHDFEAIVPELKLPSSMQIRFLFPHAPVRPISINNGEEMRAWFDFIPHSETSGSEEITISASQIGVFIEREMERGIDSERILLAGFSQGGVIALQTALRYPQRLAGVLALSTFLFDYTSTEKEQTDAAMTTASQLIKRIKSYPNHGIELYNFTIK